MSRIENIITRLKNKEERGLSDLVNALILMPLMIILIFTVLNVGNYLYTLSIVTNETALATRLVGLYGGENSTIARNKVKDLTGTTNNISKYLEQRIYDTGTGTCRVGVVSSKCEPPVVTCTSRNGIKAGSIVSCEVQYRYKSFLNGLDFGISSVLERPQTIKQSAVAEVSSN